MVHERFILECPQCGKGKMIDVAIADSGLRRASATTARPTISSTGRGRDSRAAVVPLSRR